MRKLETEEKALDGQVFDVLGTLFERTPLRKLLVEAIRYGDRPEVRARLEQVVDEAVDRDRVRELLEARSLATEVMDTREIAHIREEMERYAARRLQPHYIKAFFMEAFELLGGALREREPGRYRISYVPARIRHRGRELATPVPVWERYDRVCFDKALLQRADGPRADFLCPGHPLLDTVIALVLEKYQETLRSGAVLVDPTDCGTTPRALFFLEQTLHDAEGAHPISREVHFVELAEDGAVRSGGYAPYLDYRPATADEQALGRSDEVRRSGWLTGEALEARVLDYAIEELVPRHLARVRERREARIDKTLAAVHERLTKEINYWDRRAAELRQQEQTGRVNVKLNAARAQQRADELAARLEERTAQLQRERQIAATPPVIIGGALVLPAGLVLGATAPRDAVHTRITEQRGMQAVTAAELRLGNDPRDVSRQKFGYDIESLDPRTGRLRFIEVKGYSAGAQTVSVTRNEILTALNQPEQFILALVEVGDDNRAREPRYVRQPFSKEPDFGVTSVNYDLGELVGRSFAPEELLSAR